MSVFVDRPWDEATDDPLVEALILAIQQAVVAAIARGERSRQFIEVPAPELTAALLNVLASALESAPQCETRQGMRKVSELAGKELLDLMRGCRDIRRDNDAMRN